MPTLNVPPSLASISPKNGFNFLPKNTRRVYDILAEVYPISTLLFHSNAHKVALSLAGITDGMKVLEVATGSGEMFRRLPARRPSPPAPCFGPLPGR